jgi:hypothetical protein
MSYPEIPQYVEHQGTVKISGSTIPHKAGSCAFFFLRAGCLKVEFLCIGANANQQASKAMGVFMSLVERDRDFDGRTVAFQPLRFQTETTDLEGRKMIKDCMVWRTLLVTRSQEV